MSNLVENQLALLFERPYEPVFFPKGHNVCIDVPIELLSADNQKFLLSGVKMSDHFPKASMALWALPKNKKSISANDLRTLDEAARTVPRDGVFSLHVPSHRATAARVVSALMAAKTPQDAMALAVRARETLNVLLFQYALSVTVLHRPDLRHLRPPSLLHTMPGKFLSAATLRRCYEQANLYRGDESQQRQDIEVEPAETALNSDPEHKLAYFREDLALNLHHWHWHLVYPNTSDGDPKTRVLVAKDRRGELFYYMHQQVLARYNAERFSVGLGRLQDLKSFREPLVHGYFPKVGGGMFGESYVGRPENMKIQDVHRPDRYVELKQLERWEDRIYYAIHSNTYLDDEKKKPQQFNIDTGIDELGNMVEASDLSPNKLIYGDLHNLIHIAVSVCHDPEGKHLEGMQVMAGSEVAMRDPVFYQVHGLIDRIFREYKHSLPPYTLQELQLPAISIVDVKVQSAAAGIGNVPPPNKLFTFWQRSKVDISAGLDFAPRGTQRIVLKHLQHSDFKYIIKVSNSQGSRKCVVRLYLAPMLDDRETPLPFVEHKEYFIEMDKFAVKVPNGETVIERESGASSVTIPWEQTFRKMEDMSNESTKALQEAGYCGCGWPHHLLVPRGSAEGLRCHLVAYLTDYQRDIVETLPDSQCNSPQCKEAVSYCGARDRKYPDRRPMGFPFDRRPAISGDLKENEFILEHFMEKITNMASQEVTIIYNNTVV